jgi:PAS domain S-box-containing protein
MLDPSVVGTLNPKELRRQALARLKGRHEKVVQMPPARVESLVHEMEVYQVEMEVQNEELRRAQLEAAAALERYRDLFDEAPVGYLLLTAEGRIVQANYAALRLCFREREELEGQNLEDFLVPEDRQKLWLMLRSAAGTGVLQSSEFRLLHGGRRVRWVHADVSLLDPRVGPSRGSRMTLVDITGRVAAEEAMRQSEEAMRQSQERLDQANRVAQLGIFEHNHLSDAIEFSPLMRQMKGFGEEEEITLAAVTERVSPEDRQLFAAAVKQAHDPNGTGTFEMDFRVQSQPGRVRWLRVRAQTFFEGEGSDRRPVRTVGAALDVTERKQFQVELEQRVAEGTARLREVVGELEHFSYTLAHDLRAPVRSISGFTELLLAETSGWSSTQRRYVERVNTAAVRMDQLIRDALDYNKLVSQDFNLEAVDCDALFEGILHSYPQFQEAPDRISVVRPLPVVHANPALLTQCLSNLLTNALKFVPPARTPQVRIWAEEVPSPRVQDEESKDPASLPRGTSAGAEPGVPGEPVASHPGVVRIWVEDNGIGIDPQYHEIIFEMFQRLVPSYEGTGIGLALVKKAVTRMRGAVGVESQPGKGSRFWLQLAKPEPGKHVLTVS